MGYNADFNFYKITFPTTTYTTSKTTTYTTSKNVIKGEDKEKEILDLIIND